MEVKLGIKMYWEQRGYKKPELHRNYWPTVGTCLEGKLDEAKVMYFLSQIVNILSV